MGVAHRKPSKRDPSRPKPGPHDVSRAKRVQDYAYKKRFYQSREVAEDYDFHRWGTPERARRNLKKWRTILAALAQADDIHTILDLPCGTGRFTGSLAESGYEVVGADISLEMMRIARRKLGHVDGLHGYVRADAEMLPLRDGAFDCVMSIRFLFHLDPETRVRVLREMARVASRWLILDYRHKYSYRYATWKLRWVLGLTRVPLVRVSRAQVEEELNAAGLELVAILPVTRVFSDKWIVLARKRG
ncbi:MAG: class I SAM-dependent methyltransferase [Candidatus Dadabacteria bacterium]|nr:MAG: class I SAM-dependent methyltransferase [Candidatus Dadabacteria bacterium]